MATTEVTGEQMQTYWESKGLNKRCPNDASKPYTFASLKEVIGFCNWLSEKDGLEPLYKQKEDSSGWNLDLRKPGYRLPFDFEWEYAARFGYDFFQKDGENDWKTMKDELDKKAEKQIPIEEINSGLVNYYYQESLRTPKKGCEYPLGMYDLCGNASEICMTVEQLPIQPEKVEVKFIQMLGDDSISNIEVVAPWLDKDLSDIDITDKDRAGYGFRILRTVPINLFE
jgi:formylglycine-generating enzyme required for sulfatase activity